MYTTSMKRRHTNVNLLTLVTLLTLGAALVGYAVGRGTAPSRVLPLDAGGLTLYTDSARAQGVQLAAGSGSWSSVSDRRKKANFQREDPEQVLVRLSRLPVESWNYRAQAPAVRHVGPTAQDFYTSFRLGESDTTITATDMAGVSLLAIQALEKRTAELQAQLNAMRGASVQAPVHVDTRKR